MIFERPFPWNQKNLLELKSLFEGPDKVIEISWPWEPFHRPGFTALQYASRLKLTTAHFEKEIQNLSCPADQNGPVLPLDPAKFIEKTYELANKNIETFKTATLPTISNLREILGEPLVEKWSPEITETEEFTDVSSWLTKRPALLNSFHSLKVWDRLEFIEMMVGVIKSSSTLHFTRIERL